VYSGLEYSNTIIVSTTNYICSKKN